MRPFEIVVDVTCDIPEKLCSEWGIKVLPGHMTVPGGKDVATVQAWGEPYERKEFYAALKADPDGFTTAPPNVFEFTECMKRCVKEGKDVLALTISSGMSGTFGFATQAAETVVKQFPESAIRVIDTLRFGPAAGLLAVTAARMREAGKTLEETAAWLEENKNRCHQAGWLDDLSFVAKKGRMTNAKAFFGTLAGVKPIGEFDENGLTTVLVKATGAKAAYELMIGYIEKTIEDPEDQTVFIAQSCRRRQAEEYKRLIEERIKPKAVVINDVYPACGINIGPGLMAAYYVGSPISKGLEAEKKIFEELSKKN